MTRLHWGGAELGGYIQDGLTLSAAATYAADTTIKRSGSYSHKISSAAALLSKAPSTLASDVWFYMSMFVYVPTAPASSQDLFMVRAGIGNIAGFRMNSSGQISSGTGTPSFSGANRTGAWVELGIAFRHLSSNNFVDYICQVDGATTASGNFSGAAVAVGGIIYRYGATGFGTAWDLYMDDWAINDAAGSVENSWPLSARKVKMAVPIADSSIGADWKLGDNTAPSSNAYDSVNNIPFNGNVVASATAGQQIRDSVNNITDPNASAAFTMQDYDTVIGSGQDIQNVRAVAVWSKSTTSGTNFIFGMSVTNPTIAEATQTYNGNPAATPITATTWSIHVQDLNLPTVVRATSPTIKVSKRTASTASGVVAQLGLLIEYTPVTFQTINGGSPTSTVTSTGGVITVGPISIAGGAPTVTITVPGYVGAPAPITIEGGSATATVTSTPGVLTVAAFTIAGGAPTVDLTVPGGVFTFGAVNLALGACLLPITPGAGDVTTGAVGSDFGSVLVPVAATGGVLTPGPVSRDGGSCTVPISVGYGAVTAGAYTIHVPSQAVSVTSVPGVFTFGSITFEAGASILLIVSVSGAIAPIYNLAGGWSDVGLVIAEPGDVTPGILHLFFPSVDVFTTLAGGDLQVGGVVTYRRNRPGHEEAEAAGQLVGHGVGHETATTAGSHVSTGAGHYTTDDPGYSGWEN